MSGLITRQRLARLTGVASTQLVVQVIGFGAGIVLVRFMEQVQYGFYTLALSMAGVAIVLTDLGLATAVLAIGGRLANQRRAMGQLVLNADALYRRFAWMALAVLLPCFAALLWRQHAPAWQIVLISVSVGAATVLNVRAGMALSISRLLGQVAFQQKLDLTINAAKLGVLMLAAWVMLDATVACLVNLAVAAIYFFALKRHVAQQVDLPQQATEQHVDAIRAHVLKQAPNSLYFVVSGQLALWLIALFGTAERVAEVGALSRLAAVLTVIGAVSATLVNPYFARNDQTTELVSGFMAVNVFFGALLLALVALASAYPEPILWVLGGDYSSLQGELIWMVAAATLAAWGGTLYSVGCARGWVLPVSLSATVGALVTVATAALVDVTSVRGSFMINASTALAGTVIAFGYFALQLRRHARLKIGIQ